MFGPGGIGFSAGEAHAEQDVFQGGESAAELIALGFAQGSDVYDAGCAGDWGTVVQYSRGVGTLRGEGIWILGLLAEQDSSVGWREDSGDQVQQRRFSRAAPPDQSNMFGVAQLKGGDIDDRDALAIRRDVVFFE